MSPTRDVQSKTLSLIVIVVLSLSPLYAASAFGLQLTATPQYANYVHTYISGQENLTSVEKPIFPVLFNNTQIPIGENWTIICPLQANHNYHIYCYGAWINTSSTAKTDYDFYIYNPDGSLQSSHTESAGLPPHLGTTTDDALFTPQQSGNYSFVVTNNAVDSQGAQQATFMIIENLACDQWITASIEGNNGNITSDNCYAYEFLTSAPYVELYVKVPQTLDVYEARLYLMNNAQSPSLNGYPLAWEPGLYGNVSGVVGGYNFQSDGYRGVAYASCEQMGQPMYLNYTTAASGLHLYHVVFIGEQGAGDIQFMLKTQLDGGNLVPITVPARVYPNNLTQISYESNTTSLQTAQLSYTTDNWTSSINVAMTISNETCNATLPGQAAGTIVRYKIAASDALENSLQASGEYSVKEPATLNITAVKDTVRQGQNVTILGVLNPSSSGSIINVQFNCPNATQTINCTVNGNGAFTATFKLPEAGNWTVAASSPETASVFRCDSNMLIVTVTPPPLYMKYSLFIMAGFFGAIGAGVAVWFLKFRNK